MDTAHDSGPLLTWHLRLRFRACLPCQPLAELGWMYGADNGVRQDYTAATSSQA